MRVVVNIHEAHQEADHDIISVFPHSIGKLRRTTGMQVLGAIAGFVLGYFIGESLSIGFGGKEIFIDWPGGLIGCLIGYFVAGHWVKKNAHKTPRKPK